MSSIYNQSKPYEPEFIQKPGKLNRRKSTSDDSQCSAISTQSLLMMKQNLQYQMQHIMMANKIHSEEKTLEQMGAPETHKTSQWRSIRKHTILNNF